MPRVTAVPIAMACVLPAMCGAATWKDTPVARLEALALIESLNAEILSSSSATLTLERWCREHALADPPRILAHRIDAAVAPPTADVRSDLQVSSADPVRYRRVELTCGAHVLSVAENWYVPSRLTADMNRLLDETQTPFGKVVLPLKPHRETLAVQHLWSPLSRRRCSSTARCCTRRRTSPSPKFARFISVTCWIFRNRRLPALHAPTPEGCSLNFWRKTLA